MLLFLYTQSKMHEQFVGGFKVRHLILKIQAKIPKYTLVLALLLLLTLVLSVLWPNIRPELIEMVEETDLAKEMDELDLEESIDDKSLDKALDKVEEIPVYLTGAVKNPGIYYLDAGCILADLVAMAGGITSDAATDVVNLAMPLEAHQMVRIPKQAEVDDGSYLEIVTPDLEKTGEGQAVVNINTATLEELTTLPGIGEMTARAILSYREEHGLFKTVEDIMHVAGIKEARFAQIKDLIKV